MESDTVIYGVLKALLAAEIPFSCFDGNMSEEELDPFEFASSLVAKTRTCSAQVVRSEQRDFAISSTLFDTRPNRLGHDAVTASAGFAPDIERRVGSSGFVWLPSSGHSTPNDSTDRKPLEQSGLTMRGRIRHAIVADRSLSLNAHYIEISVGPSGVTLDGPVKSQEGRQRIESDVATVVRVGKVYSKFFVRPIQNVSETESLRCLDSNEEHREEECCRIRRLWGIRERSRF